MRRKQDAVLAQRSLDQIACKQKAINKYEWHATHLSPCVQPDEAA